MNRAGVGPADLDRDGGLVLMNRRQQNHLLAGVSGNLDFCGHRLVVFGTDRTTPSRRRTSGAPRCSGVRQPLATRVPNLPGVNTLYQPRFMEYVRGRWRGGFPLVAYGIAGHRSRRHPGGGISREQFRSGSSRAAVGA
ncbi:hypothetical protein AC20117_23190 (plasmid) [Arthrobacter crystallopoietes]|nr:hypothetical protein AC20117_22100 [Arthrobacter crystallopoietes]AUI53838.1 hypothetical protein AC20117_23190 [Arthrobacter crystallopoietes]